MIANTSFPCLLNYIKCFYYENIHEYTKEELYNEFPCTSLSFSNYQFFFSIFCFQSPPSFLFVCWENLKQIMHVLFHP